MKRYLILIALSIVPYVSMAQWHYTVSLTTSGCGYLDKIVAESQVNYWMGEGYRTFSNKNECEKSRSFVMSQSYTDGNCRVRYIASPCTGPAGTTGNANVLNSNNGSSFYSTNPANEINDWSNDYVERMLTLNPVFNSKVPKIVATGDLAFDNLIENMPYSNKDFSGRMLKGSTNIEADDNIIAIGHPVRGNGVLVSDDFMSRPFNYGLGEWHSSDLNSISIELASVGSSSADESKIGFVSNTLKSVDERLDWFNAINRGEGNVFQYMYTRWGKDNVMAGSDWWERNQIGTRISNSFISVKDAISNAAEQTIQFMLPLQYKKTGERVLGIYDAEKGTITNIIEMVKKGPDMIVNGKTIDVETVMGKERDRYMGLAATYASPEVRKVYAPLKAASDISHMPREQQKRGLSKWLVKEAKDEINKELKNSELGKKWENMEKKAKRTIDPYHIIYD